MSTLKIEGFSNHKLKQAHVSAQWANLNHMQANSITGNVKNQGKKQTTTSSLQLYKIQMISKKTPVIIYAPNEFTKYHFC